MFCSDPCANTSLIWVRMLDELVANPVPNKQDRTRVAQEILNAVRPLGVGGVPCGHCCRTDHRAAADDAGA